MARTPCFPGRWPRLDSWSGNWILYAVTKTLHATTKEPCMFFLTLGFHFHLPYPLAAQALCLLLQEAFRDFFSTGRVWASLSCLPPCPDSTLMDSWKDPRDCLTPPHPTVCFTDGETEAQARDSSSPGMCLYPGICCYQAYRQLLSWS